MTGLISDIRQSARCLAGSPGFTAIAVAALALGIGANSAVFSIVNAVLIRPLPFESPERLVVLRTTQADSDDREPFSPDDYLDVRDQASTLESMTAWDYWGHALTGEGSPVQIRAIRATSSLFELTGATAMIGRTFTSDEETIGREKVVVLDHGFWSTYFGGDRQVLGRDVLLDDEPHTVIGVMPPDFRFPDDDAIALWQPLAFQLGDGSRQKRQYNSIGRLAPGISLDEARAELATIAGRLAEAFPASNTGRGFWIDTARSILIQDQRQLMILLGSVGLVLLIACANVANLLLARGTSREKEFAVRLALGASHWRLARLMLTESLLLSLVGGGIGILISIWAIEAAAGWSDLQIPQWNPVHIDAHVLLFTFLVSILTAVAVCLPPAAQASRKSPGEALKGGAGAGHISTRRRPLRQALVIGEIAISLILLVGAGLLMNSFWRLTRVEPGFNPEGLLLVQLNIPSSRYPDDAHVSLFYESVLERLRGLPGVISAAATVTIPMYPAGIDFDLPVVVPGRPDATGQAPEEADYRVVTPDYFRTMGIPLIKGRVFTQFDRPGSRSVLIVNQEMARRFFPDDDPIGKFVSIPIGGAHEIIGIVGNVMQRGLDTEARPEIYVPFREHPFGYAALVVRTGEPPLNLVSEVEAVIHAVDATLPVYASATADGLLSDSMARRRYGMVVLGGLAGIGLLLASLGVYGIISYSVGLRRREIGLRMALGARRRDVVELIMGQGIRLVGAGVATGLLGAFVTTQLLVGLIYGVHPADPVTFAVVSLVLMVVALAACVVPAWRAACLDPLDALRE